MIRIKDLNKRIKTRQFPKRHYTTFPRIRIKDLNKGIKTVVWSLYILTSNLIIRIKDLNKGIKTNFMQRNKKQVFAY